jgi:hypothetical protein
VKIIDYRRKFWSGKIRVMWIRNRTHPKRRKNPAVKSAEARGVFAISQKKV